MSRCDVSAAYRETTIAAATPLCTGSAVVAEQRKGLQGAGMSAGLDSIREPALAPRCRYAGIECRRERPGPPTKPSMIPAASAGSTGSADHAATYGMRALIPPWSCGTVGDHWNSRYRRHVVQSVPNVWRVA